MSLGSEEVKIKNAVGSNKSASLVYSSKDNELLLKVVFPDIVINETEFDVINKSKGKLKEL